MKKTSVALAALLTQVSLPISGLAQPGNTPALPDTVTLSGAIALSLEQSPLLQALRWDIEAASGRTRQAGARPNPVTSMEVENFAGTLPGFDQSELTLSLEQLFELGGKRRARMQVARSEAGLVQNDYEVARLEVVSQVIQRYFEAMAAQQAIELQTETMGIAEEVRTSIQRRVEAGAVSPAQEIRAGIEFENALMNRQVAEHELALARIRLAALWGDSRPASFRVALPPVDTNPLPPVETLQSELSQSPGMRRAAQAIEIERARLDLAKSGRVPDLGLEFGYRNIMESDDHTFVAGVNLPLPLFDGKAGEIAAAEAQVSRAEAERARLEVELASLLNETWTAGLLARQREETLRDRILPAADRALQQIRSGFEQGRFSYVDLLEARRAWTEARQEQVVAVLQYHLAVAETEFLLGRRLIHPIQDREEENGR